MGRMIMLAATLGFVGVSGGAALAFPAPQAPTDTAAVETVAQGCGWGFHRGPWGGCRPNYYRYGWGPRYCWWRPGPWGPVRVCR